MSVCFAKRQEGEKISKGRGMKKGCQGQCARCDWRAVGQVTEQRIQDERGRDKAEKRVCGVFNIC